MHLQADVSSGPRQQAEEQAEAELSRAFNKADFANMRVVSPNPAVRAGPMGACWGHTVLSVQLHLWQCSALQPANHRSGHAAVRCPCA